MVEPVVLARVRLSMVGHKGGGGDDDGWVDVDNPPIIHPFTATPGLTCPLPTTPLGFFQLFVPLELDFFC